MRNINNRLKTFLNCSHNLKLVNNGFFFTGNSIKCAFCNIEILGDNIDPDIHMKINPYCIMVRNKYFSNLENRIKSFENWTKKQDPIILSRAGLFYTQKDDIVQCYKCNVKLCDWKDTDEPCHECVDLICSVCFDNKKTMCNIPCGHVVCCFDCNYTINSGECIICNSTVERVIKIYL